MPFWKKEDPMMRKPLKKVKDILLDGEEVLYVRDKPIKPGNFRLVLTNKRMIQVSNLTWYVDCTSWSDFRRVWIEKDVVKLNHLGTAVLPLEGLPQEDMEIIYKIAKEKLCAISNTSQTQTPTQKLKYLKEMLDEGLITPAEYDAKKSDLLSRM